MISLVVLSRFAKIFAGFRESVDRDAPEVPKHVVWDSHGAVVIPQLSDPWYESWPHEDFQIARFANIGWHTADPRSDVLYAGDDVRIIEPDTIKRLAEVANVDRQIGIVAARVRPLPLQKFIPKPALQFTASPFVAFVFVYIKRAVIDAIGYLDERFEGYGCEDLDYCYRARKAGFIVGFADGVTIQHGVDGNPHQSTFRRVKTQEQIDREDHENWRRFAEKYGLPNNRAAIWKAIKDA